MEMCRILRPGKSIRGRNSHGTGFVDFPNSSETDHRLEIISEGCLPDQASDKQSWRLVLHFHASRDSLPAPGKRNIDHQNPPSQREAQRAVFRLLFQEKGKSSLKTGENLRPRPVYQTYLDWEGLSDSVGLDPISKTLYSFRLPAEYTHQLPYLRLGN
ncbi:hypothetical protein BDV18DRAFT_117191 [Aspergillus unguis]